jgi:hypothetical protein
LLFAFATCLQGYIRGPFLFLGLSL